MVQRACNTKLEPAKAKGLQVQGQPRPNSEDYLKTIQLVDSQSINMESKRRNLPRKLVSYEALLQ